MPLFANQYGSDLASGVVICFISGSAVKRGAEARGVAQVNPLSEGLSELGVRIEEISIGLRRSLNRTPNTGFANDTFCFF